MKDKFKAVWVSHSSISDYVACPRSYYLKHIYRDPRTNHKIKIVGPALSLGSAVHEVLESLSVLPVSDRFAKPLPERLNEAWEKVAGKKGGFLDQDTEWKYKEEAREMLARVWQNPWIIKKPAIKMNQSLPWVWLSEDDDIILCGKIDWMEYMQDRDAVHIVDFKTGKTKEQESSLQLPIYLVLVSMIQKRVVEKASYWYLRFEDGVVEQPLPNIEEAKEQVLEIARKMKLARQLQKFTCSSQGGCRACIPYEKILQGEGEFVGEDEYKSDVYILGSNTDEAPEAMIL